nr:MAG TPA: hypothetical protein [Caudoviricetes sp.]
MEFPLIHTMIIHKLKIHTMIIHKLKIHTMNNRTLTNTN